MGDAMEKKSKQLLLPGADTDVTLSGADAPASEPESKPKPKRQKKAVIPDVPLVRMDALRPDVLWVGDESIILSDGEHCARVFAKLSTIESAAEKRGMARVKRFNREDRKAPYVVPEMTTDPIPIGISLAQAKAMVMNGIGTDVGITCPACTQLAKIYRRGITLSNMKLLVRVYWMFEDDPSLPFVKFGVEEKGVKTIKTTGGDYAKLRWWGLIEQIPGRREDGSTNTGEWYITDFGRQFCRRQARVPQYVWAYDNTPVPMPEGADNRMLNIDQLKKNFSYEEIMSWR